MSLRKRTYFILLLFCSASLMAFLTSSSVDNSVQTPIVETEGTTLTIVTRHDVTITDTFESRFLATPDAIALNITDIEFKQSTTDEGWKLLLMDPSKSVDIAWGGGSFLFNKMENLGLLYHINPVNDSELFRVINDTVPSRLCGRDMKRFSEAGNLIWAANTISSFGFVINHDFLDLYGLPIPNTWEELATPIYYINKNVKTIGISDPALSSMHRTIIHIILQNFGWELGWKILTRLGANSGFYNSLMYSPQEAVIDGEVGVTFAIDFYGRIAQRENPDCEYIIPEGQSLVLGDPIALAKNVDNYDASVAFLKYIYSPEGLATWLIPGLDRMPINESAFHTPEGSQYIDMYEIYNGTSYDPLFMFNETIVDLTLDIVSYYFHSTITRNYDLLRTTWGEMITQFRVADITPTEYLELAEMLGEPCITWGEAIEWNNQFSTDPDFAEDLETAWENCAREQYNSILDLLTHETPTPTESNTITTISFSILTSISSILVIRKKKRRKS